jgi:peptide/nickel transport system permease protein/oligopeptide transport system permease protein
MANKEQDMSREGILEPAINKTVRHVSEARRFFKVFFSRKVVVLGMVIILLFVIAAIFAPWLAPYNPDKIDMNSALLQPGKAHWLGTDSLGRDTLSRTIYGTRISLEIGLIVVVLGSFVGMALGLIAGYFGGWTHAVIMRLIDGLMAFPMIILALLISSLLGGGIKNVIIALSFTMVPAYARLMCGQVMTAKENDYILAERSMGASHTRIMLRHLAPNCFPPLIVMMTMMLGTTILAEAGLSFLGIGVQPPVATWGNMVNDGRQYLLTNPVLSFAPGLAIMLVVYAFNMVGDGLRDALDPLLRGVI